ncbi:MAG: carboxylating nicotinate-nucleotide diphosphorylase [Candidatus Methanomethylophilaceae archaeon]|nr:carboxylating nicotinate-nucleotide diphosphorylase [Candidatus Methanomethylophilaceae archaeon]
MDRLQEFLEEDLGSGDITTELIVPDRIGKAIIRCEAAAILAGIEEAATIFEDGDLDVEILSEDGDEVGAGQAVMEVEGPLADILTRERTALNMLMRMSGIATMTDAAIEACQKANPDVRIAATRKTTPGFRFFEKKAVILGGGDPHRYGLYDHILIKDNHILACGGVRKAMELVQDAPFTYKVEIEVESQKDAVTAAQMGADIILLDNMPPAQAMQVRKAVKDISPRILIEVSGNIGMHNVADYAAAADIISMGALTHSPAAVHFSLHLV